MRELPVAKLLASLMVLLVVGIFLSPSAAEAKTGDEDEIHHNSAIHASKTGDEDELTGNTNSIQAKAGDEDELVSNGSAAGDFQEGSLAETGIIGLITLLVAVIGALSLHIIGNGYRKTASSD